MPISASDVEISILAILEKYLPVFTFFLGFFTSRFTMTKKERKDYQNTLQENANKYSKELDDTFSSFANALQKYIQCSESSLNEFQNITITGEAYFSAMKRLCNAILEGNISKQAIEYDFCQRIKEFVEKNISLYYETLTCVAEKIGLPYSGSLKRENYESVYLAYDKYCAK